MLTFQYDNVFTPPLLLFTSSSSIKVVIIHRTRPLGGLIGFGGLPVVDLEHVAEHLETFSLRQTSFSEGLEDGHHFDNSLG